MLNPRNFRPQVGSPRPAFDSLPISLDSLSRLKALRSTIAAANLPPANELVRYQHDPVGFIHDVCGGFLWSKQREICESVMRFRHTAVHSCHDSGKSFTAAGIACWWVACHPPGSAFVVTSAPTFSQVRAILWREIHRTHTRGKLPGYCNQTEWMLNNELVAFGRKPDDMDPAAFQGIHARYVLVIFDEACGMPAPLYDAAESLVTNEDSRFLEIGNPDDPNTEFCRSCMPGSSRNVIHISAHDTPNFTEEEVPEYLRPLLVHPTWVEERRRKWGVSSPIFISKILGQFPEVSEDSLIPLSWVREAIARELDPGLPIELGVDVARFGRNETVIIRRRGPQARLVATARKRDTMHVTGLVVSAIEDTFALFGEYPSRVKIDDNGLGGGVTDRLREMQREGSLTRATIIVPVNVGISLSGGLIPEDKSVERMKLVDATVKGRDVLRFRDVKMKISWHVRMLFENGDIDLDDDPDLQAQVCAVKYDLNSRGQLFIESKEDMEERLRRIGGTTAESQSPDRWDALVLAFAEIDEENTWELLARRAYLDRMGPPEPAPASPPAEELPQPMPQPMSEPVV